MVAATLGATLLFLAARTMFRELLEARVGPWLARLQRGFAENELSYLLVLRLVPLVPFFVVNLVPAFLGVRLRNFVLATLFGIVCGIALVLLIDYLDVSLRSAADVEKRLELPVLGVIPALGGDAPFGGRPAPRDRDER